MEETQVKESRSLRIPVVLWLLLLCGALTGSIPLLKWSFFHADALIIWGVSALIITYYLFQPEQALDKPSRHLLIYLGFAIVVMSLLNIPLGFGEPPFSIGDLSILLSGLSVMFFGYLGNRNFIIPAILPSVAVFGFQVYIHLTCSLETMMTLFVQPVILSTQAILALLGLQVTISSQYLSFWSITGDPIILVITDACSGFWSFGTYTLLVALIFFSFPRSFSPRGLILIIAGYIGVYCTNVLRVLSIALTGYYTGSYFLMNTVHMYMGWIFFLMWMIIFWSYFIIRFLQVPLLSLQWK